jgi:hypothetical protein
MTIQLANPNFHVSTTRLSVRNLSKNVTEKELKSAFLRAARSEGDTSKIRIKQATNLQDHTTISSF